MQYFVSDRFKSHPFHERVAGMLIVCCLFGIGCQPSEPVVSIPNSQVPVVTPGGAESAASKSVLEGSDTNTSVEKVELLAKDYQGTMDLVKSHRGKVVVLDVWNSSCIPCIREFPGLVALHRRFGRSDLVCLSMCLDYVGVADEPPETFRPSVMEFLDSRGATFQNVLLTEPSDDVLEKLNLFAPPAVLVYGRDGSLSKRFDNESSNGNEFTYKEIGELVEKLIAVPAVSVQ